MSDEEICDALGWPRRAAEVLAADSEGLLPRIRAVVREAERREREACARVCYREAAFAQDPIDRERIYRCADDIRARGNK